MGNSAAHHHHRAHTPREFRVDTESEAKVGEWTNGEQVNLSRQFTGEAQDLRDRVFRARTALRRWLVGVAETVFAMHPLSGGKWLCHWSARTDGDRHVVKSAELK